MEQQMVATEGASFESLPIEIKQHIFRYCGTKTRRSLMLVCKDWADALHYFHEDFHVDLHHCYLRDDLEPVSLLMNSTRRFHSLYLGPEIHADTMEVKNRFLAHLGREVQVLDLSSAAWSFLVDLDFLVLFPKLKKLTVPKLDSLRAFRSFPKTLEHVHLKILNMMEYLDRLHSIKSLKLLTADRILWALGTRVPSATSIYSLDENLKVLLKSHTWNNVYLKCNTNFIDAPTITFNDVLRINITAPPSIFFSFHIFPKLRSICIQLSPGCNQEQFCFNFHQAVLCGGVTELEIRDNTNGRCSECFRSLIDSFPNVKKIVLYNCIITNQLVKHIIFKLPNLVHLETASENLIHEIICHDQPEYLIGNLKQLETLLLPNCIADSKLIHFPFMPALKKVQFGELPDDHVLINFTDKTPNLEYFEIGKGSLLTDTGIETIAKNWPNLHTLRLHSTKACDVSPIKRFCKNLRSLELYSELRWHSNSVHTVSSFFNEIPTLREMHVEGVQGKWELGSSVMHFHNHFDSDPPMYRYLKEWQEWD